MLDIKTAENQHIQFRIKKQLENILVNLQDN